MHLGYLDVVGEQYAGILVVMSVDAKYSPKMKMYSLKNGTTLDFKIDKKLFAKNKLSAGDIVRILSSKTKPKMRRCEDGTFEEVPNTAERWITNYRKVENL